MADGLLRMQVAMIGMVLEATERFQTWRRDERGQTSAEYMGMLLVVAAIMAIAIGAASGLGLKVVSLIQQVFEKAVSKITSAG